MKQNTWQFSGLKFLVKSLTLKITFSMESYVYNIYLQKTQNLAIANYFQISRCMKWSQMVNMYYLIIAGDLKARTGTELE